ncbi:MAG TPA: transglycosylase SLT domain-containing protein [Gemmatimonadales bacterium]|nr:transglycosylase SLT domain-containing protein [Gemmatimonadales bacterium]
MARPIDYGEPKPMTAERILIRGGLLLAAAVGIGALGGWNKAVRAASDHATIPDASLIARRMGNLSEQLEASKGESMVLKLQLERANTILENSTRYQIPADLSAAIYDIALSEGIDPSLGYQLVKIESQFNRKAKSNMRAYGYTQLQVETARFYQPNIKEKDLYDRDTNLRLGFRFLNELLARFQYDVHLALLAYNRGPKRVDQILAQGGNPANGYSDAVLKGYRPLTNGVSR